MKHKLISLLFVGFFSFILWIIYLANTGQNSIFFQLVASMPYGDKLGHFCLFGLLTLVTNAALRFRSWQLKKLPIYLGTIVVFSFASLEELSQYFIANRTLDIDDFIADVLGIALFSLITYWLVKYKNSTAPSLSKIISH